MAENSISDSIARLKELSVCFETNRMTIIPSQCKEPWNVLWELESLLQALSTHEARQMIVVVRRLRDYLNTYRGVTGQVTSWTEQVREQIDRDFRLLFQLAEQLT